MVHYEPTDMKLLEEDPVFVQSFASVGFLCFCQELQGFHGQIAKDFVINFTGTETKVGLLNFAVSSDTISHETEIPMSGEMRFNVQKFKKLNCDDFPKDEYTGIDTTAGISSVRNILDVKVNILDVILVSLHITLTFHR